MENWTFLPLKSYEPPPQPLPEVTDWRSCAQALEDYLHGLGAGAPYAGFPRIVAGLFGNAGKLLNAWAKERGAQILEAPPAEALLDGSAELWPELQNPGDTLYVIPSLERCFLRHFRGIRLARQLVETVWANPCRLVIGCDAWGWKYLQQAVQIDALSPDAITNSALMAHPAVSETMIDIAPRAKDSRIHAYVLHTLLVHEGMAASVLPQLLPFRATQVLKTLADLREQQLAFEEYGVWRVAPAQYSAIRKQLAAVEFWVDGN
jgi:hypothetical protein